MIANIDPQEMLAAAGNRLYLDYFSGAGTALDFFAHSPLSFSAALDARRGYDYPRGEASRSLAEYNTRLGSHRRALANIDALGASSTFCVITGQQAGFLGGPAYTAYKIITTIRLAAYLEERLGARFVPVFWLATEDHDFGEINHAHYYKGDGEIGRVRFFWEHEGRPIADLPVSEDVKRAYAEYLANARPGPYLPQVEEWFAPRSGESFAEWQARTWSQLFSERGLVILEPRVLCPLAKEFFRFALKHGDEIRRRLVGVSRRLAASGYVPALTSPQAGQLYTSDPTGRRVRVKDAQKHLVEAGVQAGRYSTDAALRPLFADAMLPVAVSVLGPGETAYHAMLKPLYDLFGVPQPLLFPRKSYTIVTRHEDERIAHYRTSVRAILTEQLDVDATFRSLMPVSELERFSTARRGMEAALTPLRPYLESIDPSLGKTWVQTLANSTRSLDKLKRRAQRARMGRLGFSRGELRALCNVLLPRGRLQERVFPLPHFINRHGTGFIDTIFSAGNLDEFTHHIVTLEDGRA